MTDKQKGKGKAIAGPSSQPDIQVLQTRVADLGRENTALRTDVKVFRARVDHLERENAVSRGLVNTLAKSRREAEDKLNTSKETIQKLCDEGKKAVAKKNTYKGRNIELEAANKALREAMDAVRAQNAEIDAGNVEIEQQNTEINAHNAQVDLENVEAKASFDQIREGCSEAVKSWALEARDHLGTLRSNKRAEFILKAAEGKCRALSGENEHLKAVKRGLEADKLCLESEKRTLAAEKLRLEDQMVTLRNALNPKQRAVKARFGYNIGNDSLQLGVGASVDKSFAPTHDMRICPMLTLEYNPAFSANGLFVETSARVNRIKFDYAQIGLFTPKRSVTARFGVNQLFAVTGTSEPGALLALRDLKSRIATGDLRFGLEMSLPHSGSKLDATARVILPHRTLELPQSAVGEEITKPVVSVRAPSEAVSENVTRLIPINEPNLISAKMPHSPIDIQLLVVISSLGAALIGLWSVWRKK